MTRNEARKRAWTFKELKKTCRMMREEEGGMKGRRRRGRDSAELRSPLAGVCLF